MSFTVLYCTPCIVFFFRLLILSICLSVYLLFVCLWAVHVQGDHLVCVGKPGHF